jgi:hypothetical protein
VSNWASRVTGVPVPGTVQYPYRYCTVPGTGYSTVLYGTVIYGVGVSVQYIVLYSTVSVLSVLYSTVSTVYTVL